MISISDTRLTLSPGGNKTVTQSIDVLRAVYCLSVGSDVLANDSTCYLLVFDNQLWLIPDDTAGIKSIRNLRHSANQANIVYATIDYLPYQWRSRWLIFPGTCARLKVLGAEQLEVLLKRIIVVSNGELDSLFII